MGGRFGPLSARLPTISFLITAIRRPTVRSKFMRFGRYGLRPPNLRFRASGPSVCLRSRASSWALDLWAWLLGGGCDAGDRTYKLLSGITSEYERCVKSLGGAPSRAQSLGVRPLRIHDARHTWTTLALHAGKNHSLGVRSARTCGPRVQTSGLHASDPAGRE